MFIILCSTVLRHAGALVMFKGGIKQIESTTVILNVPGLCINSNQPPEQFLCSSVLVFSC